MSSRRRIGVNRRFVRDASGAFTPKSIAGLTLWLRADMGITIGTGVSAWADQSGTGDANKNVVQAVGGSQPTLATSDASYGNRPTVQFGGAHELNPAGAWASAPVESLSIYVIGHAAAATGLLSNPGASVAPWNLLYAAAGTAYATFFSDRGSLVSTTRSVSTPRCTLVELTATSSAVYSDNTATPTQTGARLWGATASTGISLGHGTAGIANLTGTIAEVIVFSRILTSAEKSLLAQNLSNRYGLAIT